MAISMSRTGRSHSAEPNVTPMIDVLLVLLVIFMLKVSGPPKSIDLQLPQETGESSAAPIVLDLQPAGVYLINAQRVGKPDLARKLAEVYRNRPQKVIYLKADASVRYQEVIDAADAARGAGVKVIGAVLPN